MSQFVHLHLHTEYSLADSIVRVPRLMQQLSQHGMTAVALTDVNNLFALVKFYQKAIKNGIKPIIGLEAQIAGLTAKEPNSRVVFLCKNKTGYQNLTKLVTQSYLQGQKGSGPTIEREWLEGIGEDLIVLSGARDGDVGRAILAGNKKLSEANIEFWAKNFSTNYYIELQRTGREDEELYNEQALRLATEFSLPVVATNDVRFLHRREFDAHETRVCINAGRILNDPRRPKLYSEQQYLRDEEEMLALFEDIPEAIINTVEIAKRCNVQLTFGENVLPEFPIPDEMTPQEYMLQQSEQGLKRRLRDNNIDDEILIQEYQQRLNTELAVINEMGYPGYFLIVADFTSWAKNNGVPVGPGRGSGAGSLVAYVLGITDIDPLQYDLLFERFLNPERVSMPDFDIDFCMDNRDRVIDYVAQRYGRTHVSQIITYGTMAARGVVRDVGRVMGHPYGFVDRIAKLIPFEVGMTLSKALEREEALQEQYKNEEDVRAVFDRAIELEGIARNAGKHAGGVVIAPTELTDFTPLYCEAGGNNIVTQLDKDDVEAIGLVKFDFLGLRTLTIIDNTLKLVNKKLKKLNQTAIEIEKLPLDDEATYTTLKNQQTTAVFQLESSGIKDIIKRLKPDKFDDIVALVALYRPGPLQSGMVEDFILRKHGARVDYFHPDLEPILQQTYGVILYQEQVMQIAQVLAGYTLGGADLLRRAMGKKKAEEMAKQREIFVTGAVERGVEQKLASHIFDLMEKFAGYGFNKSHSVAYALLAYQTAWLKTHFPAEFMCSVMSSDLDNTDKVVNLIDECRGMHIKVMPPDVNSSNYNFTVPKPGSKTSTNITADEGQSQDNEEKIILYGLGAIKGVGQNAVEQIVEERASSGGYKDLDEFCLRLGQQKVNRRCIEALIRCGAMDSFGYTRATLFKHLDKSLRYAEQCQRDSDTGQNDMFGHSEKSMKSSKVLSVPEWEDDKKLLGERETLGLYLTGHPITRYQSELKKITSKNISQLLDSGSSLEYSTKDSSWQARRNEKIVLVAGLLDQIRIRNSPKGRIAFITLDDNTGRIDVAVFANDYARYDHLLKKDEILIIKGSLGWDDFSGQVRLRANEVWSFDQYLRQYGAQLNLVIRPSGGSPSFVSDLQEILLPFKDGECSIYVKYQNNKFETGMKLPDDWNISLDEQLLQRLNKISEVLDASIKYKKQEINA